MIDFTHSDTASIRCPLHNQHESFTAGHTVQPEDPLLVRYPCGYVDGLAPSAGVEPFAPDAGIGKSFEILKELSNRLQRLEERPYTRPTVPRMEPRPTEPTTSKEPSILEQYANPDK